MGKVKGSVKAIFVSHFDTEPVGHGGKHRAYQIAHDLGRIVGEDNLVVVSLPHWRQSQPAQQAFPPVQNAGWGRVRRIGRKIALVRTVSRMRLRMPFLFVEHPVDLLANRGPTTRNYSIPEFVTYYEELLRDIEKPAVCVIGHPGFADLLEVNSRYGIPTVSCTHNIESFDSAVPLSCGRAHEAYAAAINFADELGLLARCDARLFISRVEVGLVSGFGLRSYHYPYLPVGAIRRSLERIRQARAEESPQEGLFLMLGTGGHRSTWESFLWFVQSTQEYGLPQGIRVVVSGRKTDQLLASGVSVEGLELKGWLEQDELDKLLVQVQAVLVPQGSGFGALTRLPELSCAGIPAIVSRHPTYALNLPPGIEIVDDDWDAWCSRMEQVTSTGDCFDPSGYHSWEEDQANPLEWVMK